MITMTAKQLRDLADRVDNEVKHGNGAGFVSVSIKGWPNGRKYLEFEQPCVYAECFSTFYRYDEENQKEKRTRKSKISSRSTVCVATLTCSYGQATANLRSSKRMNFGELSQPFSWKARSTASTSSTMF